MVPCVSAQALQGILQHLRPFSGHLDGSSTVTEPFDLIIVGAGPAGLAACAAATGHGLSVALVDERRTLGGSVAGALGASADDPDACWLTPPIGATAADRALVEPLVDAASRATVLTDALAWGLFPGWTLAVARDGRTERLDAHQIVLATGRAVARPVFPGHQLGGVVGPLGLLRAIDRGEARPGERLVVLGDGPLSAAIRAQADAAGLELVAVLGEGAPSDDPHHLPLQAPPQAGGAVRLERVDLIVDGATRRLMIDWLCVTEPDSGATELAGMAGVAVRFAGYAEGYRPVCGPDGRTAAPGCYVAGAMAGSAELATAIASGRAAGTAAAVRAGQAPASALEEALAAGAGEYVPAPAPAPRRVPVLLRHLPDDHVIACHCTGHTTADVRAAIAAGARSIDDVKRQAKVGMGLCQGRDCQRVVTRALELVADVDVATLHAMRPRPPVRPLTARAMYAGEVDA
jgi:bacterioferritin-associated ferredoxin